MTVTGPIEIRRATAADAPALTRLAYAAVRYWRYPEALILQWKDALTLDEGMVDRCPVHCAVAGGQVVAFHALGGEGATRTLTHFWVEPERIGSGVGTRLFEHLLLTLRAEGASVLRIASDPHAEGFFRRMGAERLGDVPSVPAGRTLPLLEYRLAP